MSVVPESIRDPTTIYNNHTMGSYLPCVILRVTIGLIFILAPSLFFSSFYGKWAAIILAALASILFGLKWFVAPGQDTWKVFLRTSIIYFIVAILLYTSITRSDPISLYTICGALIIIDALMGLQSRHTVQVIRRIALQE
jgi:hypothetical protein